MPKTKAPTAAANIYAVVGSDEAEVKRVAVELAQKLTPRDAGDFGLELIDGAADNAEQAAARIRSTIEALQTLPFFGSTKVVWLKNANFLGDNAIGRAASVQSVLEELSDLLESGLGSELTFLVSATEVDKRRGFYKTLVKRAEIQVFDRLDSGRSGWEEEATEIVRRRAKKRKLQFDEDALDLFVLLTGGDTRQIENELEKIDIFLGKDRAVHVDLVREIVPLSRAGVIFELSNALATRDLEMALTLVRRLLDQAAILRATADVGGSTNAYALGIAAQHAHRFETTQLIAAMQACLEANLQLVTTQLDHELILTELVVKLLGESNVGGTSVSRLSRH